MTRPRSTIVSLRSTPYYHCISRCVRRAFLCGKDAYTKQSFEHRKPWLVDRMFFLSSVFAVDIAAYAVMSNHYHLVMHIDTSRGKTWSDQEVIKRWLSIYKGPPLIHDYLKGRLTTAAENFAAERLVNIWRSRLHDISWFMRCLNEYIARKANHEDGCTGRFWEGRFKSQALIDETALISCMAYVDLNPVRAGIARNLQESEYTSAQERTISVKTRKSRKKRLLMQFTESRSQEVNFATLPFHLKDYLELVDWTGRHIRTDKKGFIDNSQHKILSTLGISGDQWHYLALDLHKRTITTLHGMEVLSRLQKHRRAA